MSSEAEEGRRKEDGRSRQIEYVHSRLSLDPGDDRASPENTHMPEDNGDLARSREENERSTSAESALAASRKLATSISSPHPIMASRLIASSARSAGKLPPSPL
jgi:hypothetical protein